MEEGYEKKLYCEERRALRRGSRFATDSAAAVIPRRRFCCANASKLPNPQALRLPPAGIRRP